jgi:valyl-tRNA synthetase
MEQFGTDALRFTLASMASPGRDIKLAEERIEGYRNFANKIWNAARFAHMYLDGAKEARPPKSRSFPDRWILSRLNETIRTIDQELEAYRFDRAASALYQFFWHEYCDWYLELIKPVLQDPAHPEGPSTRHTLSETLEVWLRLLHPFMPFLSEEIWQTLPHQGETITTQVYPKPQPEWKAEEAEADFGYLHQFVMTARTMRALLSYPPGKTISVFGNAQSSHALDSLKQNYHYITHLGRLDLKLLPIDQWSGKNVLQWAIGSLTIGVLVEGDVDLNKALARIGKERSEKVTEASRIQSKLSNTEFRGKAPAEVITEHELRLHVLNREHEQLASSEQQLRAMLGA